MYRYIIEDDELDIRFAKFEEWLEEIESVTIKNKGYGTMRNFKEILHLEENIAEEENREKVKKFQKSITYQWWDRNKYPKPWINDDVTDKIIEKIVETKGFAEEQSDVGELESSDNLGESSSNEGDKHIERIYRNYWLENGYEIDIEEIKRIINFRVEYEIIKTKEFMSFYKTIEELDDKGIEEELRIWHYMYTIECPTCNKIILKKEAIEAVEYNKEFIEKICKSCYEKGPENLKDENKLDDETEIEKRLERLKNLIKVLEIEVSDGELLRLISMRYRDVDILSADFIRKFQEYKNESEKEIRRILDEYLKKFEIEESEEEIEEENNNTDDSEKIGEILDPEEYEIWEGNSEDFNENEVKNNDENIINTESFSLSQNSDSNNSLNIKDSDIENSDTESELSDYNLQDLFQENILLNMATEDQMKRIIENALGYPPNTLDGLIGAGAHLVDRIENAGNEAGGIINIPLFYGKEEEDVSDWIRQFEVAFTAIGKAAGTNSERQAAYTAAHLRGAAAQWYNEMKETNASHLRNWADADDDNDLKHRIKRRFTREDVRRRKMLELRKTKQGINESVEDYTRRFRQVLRVATRGHALADEYQVDFYIEGLEATVGYQVRRQNPGNLNDAINIARRKEETRNELFRKAGNIPDRVYPEIGKERIEERNVGMNVRYNKPLNENYEDELVEKLEKMRIAKLEKQVRNMERELNNNGNKDQLNQRRNNRAPINYDEITCFRCHRRGHFATRCPLENNIRRNERRVNLMTMEIMKRL
ncbi:hypothetical protein RirG_136540 [Rhizophagus irregularis DAOM 197198w]|uniref:CCHC-type domain-containing protein n=1 Tax=Rhizophagus irregularis (strain DAOM 197198w) TaxID=1432141 RepID=A0A015JDP6_RHIIW|nr:hypothetical protein RirG_136540 [Rhizophagus irregularis DAOM 197198w]